MKFRRPTAVEPEIQLAPLIDVILLLLLFYSVAATFTEQPRIDLQLPKSGTARVENADDGVLVAVERSGRFVVGGADVPADAPEALNAALKRALERSRNDGDAPKVTILGDAQAPHQAIVQAMDAARANGVAAVRIATRDEATGADG